MPEAQSVAPYWLQIRSIHVSVRSFVELYEQYLVTEQYNVKSFQFQRNRRNRDSHLYCKFATLGRRLRFNRQ
jgi:hypothetical protein